jgi:hypothetical protein
MGNIEEKGVVSDLVHPQGVVEAAAKGYFLPFF